MRPVGFFPAAFALMGVAASDLSRYAASGEWRSKQERAPGYVKEGRNRLADRSLMEPTMTRQRRRAMERRARKVLGRSS